MEMNEKKNSISAMMEASMDKIRQMVNSEQRLSEQFETILSDTTQKYVCRRKR